MGSRLKFWYNDHWIWIWIVKEPTWEEKCWLGDFPAELLDSIPTDRWYILVGID